MILSISMSYPSPSVQIFTSTGTHTRFLATWESHTLEVHQLLLAPIKDDICIHLAAAEPKADLKDTQPLSLVDPSRDEEELREELQYAIAATQHAPYDIANVQSTFANVDESPVSILNEPTIFVKDRSLNPEPEAMRANPMSMAAHRLQLRKPSNAEAHNITIDPRLVDSKQHEPDA